jgi:4,5-dihydroxyphthalate decarboxylase
MPDLHLSLACSSNPRTRPVIEGAVRPDGIDLRVTVLHPSEMFWRQLHFEEFDVSEMSMSSLLMTIANGDRRWLGIPIFTSRAFYHTGVLTRVEAGIEKPEELRGKRIGVPEYQQTAALWARAALEHVYGVKASDLRWWMERNEEMSHGGATGFTPPSNIEFHYIPPERSMGDLLLAGELDASLLYLPGGNLVDRSTADLRADPRFRPLFPDAQAEGINYYRRTGFYPINHGFVIKRSVYEEHPWVVLNLFNTFAKAREQWRATVRENVAPFLATGFLKPEGKGAEADLFPYGVRANREILSAIPRFSHEQGLTSRVVDLEEIFAPQTLDI